MRIDLKILFAFGAALATFAQQPIAYVEKPGNAKLLRSRLKFPLDLAAGQFLFEGDRVSVLGGQESVIWFCPAKQILRTLDATTLVFNAKQMRQEGGKPVSATVSRFCELPKFDRRNLVIPRYLNWVPPGVVQLAERLTPADIRNKIPPERDALFDEIQSAQIALDMDPANVMARITKGAILQQIGEEGAALSEYQTAAATAPGPGAKELVHRSATRLVTAAQLQEPGVPNGRTFALVVGISKYEREDRALRYAHRDAEVFYDLLRTPRGGSVPAENIALLVDERATNGRIINELHRALLDRARAGDTIIFFMSSHGASENGRPYLIPHNANADNLHDTGIDMGLISELLEFGVGQKCRVLIFLDVCRAGAAIGVNASSAIDIPDGSSILVMAATKPTRPAIEAIQFGGGHSAFSYFVLKGLNGEADRDGNGRVESEELVRYVRDQVERATICQSPQASEYIDERAVIVPNVRLPGIVIGDWTSPPGCGEAPPEAFVTDAAPSVKGTDALVGVKGFDTRTVLEQRVLALLSETDFDESQWFSALHDLKRELTLKPDRYRRFEDEMRIALQDRGQRIILRYLEGEARPQVRGDFLEGERYYQAALLLDPDAPALVGRLHFCRGRRLIFDKRYQEAIGELQQAAVADPEGPYIYNAIGIAYLEQAQLELAITAFSDAQRLAPRWLYPRHNLALALAENRQIDRAREVLVAAMRQAPAVPYLAYSKGLLEVRANRLDDAAKSFERAIAIDDKHAFGYDGLAFVLASRGKTTQAEQRYREALALEPSSAAIHHNLALLLVRMGRTAEAEREWTTALRLDPDFATGLAGLAEFQAKQGNWTSVIPLLRRLARVRPEYGPARVLLAEALFNTGDVKGALAELDQVAASPDALALRGDIVRSQGQGREAVVLYQKAQRHAAVSRKLKRELSKRIRTAGRV